MAWSGTISALHSHKQLIITCGMQKICRAQGANLSEKLSEYGLMVPFSTDSQGHYISHVVSATNSVRTLGRRRAPRSIRVPSKYNITSSQHVFFNVTIFGKELHLRLKHNSRLVAPDASVEWQEDFEKISREPMNCHCTFTGEVTDMPGATVAISNCDGLAGLIRTDSGEFFIEPLEKGQQEVEENGRVHVVYRRSAVRNEVSETKESKGPHFGIGEFPNSLGIIEQELIHPDRKRRHAKKDDYNIEVLLAVDDSVVRFHGKEHVQNYVLTLMNIVDEIYHDESLGTHINIVLVRIIMVGYRQIQRSMMTVPTEATDIFYDIARVTQPCSLNINADKLRVLTVDGSPAVVQLNGI
ncbi:ATS14 metalloproteinase, partial [Polypterus senegalus]